MGLLDQIMGAIGGSSDSPGESGPNLLSSALQLINDPNTGGLNGLLQSFQEGGLGQIAKSWVSTGENMPIMGEQLQSILGDERVQNIAGQLGISTEDASGQLATLLPTLIDKLTPDGTVPDGDDLVSRGLGMLKGGLSD